MFSADVKVVFGFDPSGLLEKVILAPAIGTPRTVSFPRADDDESEFDVVTGSVLFGVEGASVVLGAFGTLIFGIVIVNCPTAGCVRNEVTAMAAIRIRDDDLVIKKDSPQSFKFDGWSGGEYFSLILVNQDSHKFWVSLVLLRS
jgi:hypothetical protein